MKCEIRIAEVKDLESITQLFKDCVLSVCKADYNDVQLQAWASSSLNRERWLLKIQNQIFIVATKEEAIVGFGSLEGIDTIDLLYVHKDFQRQGVAEQLFTELFRRAQQNGATRIKADVSKTARGFFESRGFKVDVAQQIERDGVMIENFKMIKAIS